MTTFEKGDYFFKQKIAEQYIIEYIRNLPDANTDEEALQLDSEKVLKSIEAQHGLLVERAKGIYSFSHLTFHEYFTAREFVVGKQSSAEALQNLVSYMMGKRWREVFLLAVGMSPNADSLLLLMKEKVDGLLANDEKLQQYLVWVNLKSLAVDVPYKPAAVRAFYFSLSLDLSFSLSLNLFLELSLSFFQVLSLSLSLLRVLSLSLSLSLDLYFDLDFHLSRILYFDLDAELKQALQQLKEQLTDKIQDETKFKAWWKANGQAWTEQLRSAMIKYRNIGHDWQLSKQQKELLNQYYDANKFLVECLNSDCYVSREVRQEIEDTLLLPIAEIKQRQQQIES
ncbi:MAG: hypothetical protein QNJ47_02415 [Nostocaceae cyanobacterium]|nr:hypothetical protein [Nostocaceae cyanobacterium]